MENGKTVCYVETVFDVTHTHTHTHLEKKV